MYDRNILRFLWRPQSTMWRVGAVGAVLVGAAVAVVNTIGPAATIQPVSVNGRTWLPIPRGNHASLILANGISGLVEAGGENEAIDLPTDLAFAGSSAAATVLQSPAVSVVVANDTHRETILDVAPGTRSRLVGDTIVSFGAKARIHRLDRGEAGTTIDVELGGDTAVGDDPPVVDGQGRVWALIAGALGTRAVAISPATATVEFVDVTDPVGRLIVVDGAVYHASPAGITPLGGGAGALTSVGAGSVVPDLAVATLGVWAVAQGDVVTAITGGTQQLVTAPDDVTAVAVWHGSVWAISADVLYRLVGGSLDRVAAVHGAQRAYTDGGRAWFVGSDAVVSVDDRQNAVVFDLSDVDIALCVQTCSAADAARYIDELPPPKKSARDVPAEPPSQITLPPVLPTPAPTSPVTDPPLTVTPPTSTEPTSIGPTSTPPTSTRRSTTTTSTATVTPTATSTDLPAVTTPATEVPLSSAPPTVAETSPRPTRPTRPAPDPPPIPTTIVETSIVDSSVPGTTEPGTTAPSTTVAPAQGHLVLAFAGSDDPITTTSVDVIAGWDGSAETCSESPPIGTLAWSGAGQGSQFVQVDFSNPASVSFNVSPGTLVVTFTVCAETAEISRVVASGQPSVDAIGFTPAAPEPGETVQAVASITTAGWGVVGASWLGGLCAQSLTALASTFDESTTSATLSTSVAGPYCVSVVVSFTTSSASTTADGSGQVIASPSTTTTTDTTTTAPETTTTTSSTTTVSTEPPTTTAPETTTTTEPATTTTSPTTTSPTTTSPTTTSPTTTSPTTTSTTQPPTPTVGG